MNRRNFLRGLATAPLVAAAPAVLARFAPAAAAPHAAPTAATAPMQLDGRDGSRTVISRDFIAVYDKDGVERCRFGQF